MVNVKIDNDTLLEMLMERVNYWTEDKTTRELYKDMYANYIEGGCFDGMELDIDAIVDNDYINYCNVIEEGDEDFETIKEVYEAQGLGDCSCEDCHANWIEAVNSDETAFLTRW